GGTPGEAAHYHPDPLVTSPPLIVRIASKVVGSMLDLRNLAAPSAKTACEPPACGLARCGSSAPLVQCTSSGFVHRTGASASSARIVFDVPSVMCRMSAPRVGSNGVLTL